MFADFDSWLPWSAKLLTFSSTVPSMSCLELSLLAVRLLRWLKNSTGLCRVDGEAKEFK